MAYLAVINNPYDSVRFRRIINEPKRGIGDATVEEIIRISDGLHISPVEVCREASQFESLSRKSAALQTCLTSWTSLRIRSAWTSLSMPLRRNPDTSRQCRLWARKAPHVLRTSTS